jgi:2-methylcitrate dehydratase PrpD
VLRVRLKNGETREAHVWHNRGGPENPLSDEELETKFHTNATRVLSREDADVLRTALQNLENLDRVDEITRLAQEE